MQQASFEFANPYPIYTQWRNERPIYQAQDGTWYFTRYQDVKFVLSDKRFVRRPPETSGYIHTEAGNQILREFLKKWPIFNDPPEHTVIRGYLKNLFLPQFIKEKRQWINAAVDELLPRLLNTKHINFMQDFAFPLPVMVLNRLLGTDLPISKVRTWSMAVSSFLDHGTPEDLERLVPIMLEMQNFFGDFINGQQYPENSWIEYLVRLKTQYHFTENEVVSMCVFLLMAGHETLQLSIGLAVLTLLKHREQLLTLQAQPNLLSSAIEEILRYESPLTKVSRWTTEDIYIENTLIPAKQLVVVILNSANRDPSKFPNPDKFDIKRQNNRHLTFGYSLHHCLGALLARVELQAGLGRLIPHLNQFEIMENNIHWLENSSFRYLNNLPLTNTAC